MSGTMDCCGLSDIGRHRKVNEDQFLIADVRKSMRVHHTSLALDHQTRLFGGTQGNLLLVADGMGGHDAGERASQLVIDTFVDYALNQLSWFMHGGCETDGDFEGHLKAALVACQRRLDREVAAIPQRRGMGSTLTLAYITWPRLFLVHVGDSRCYLLRDGKLQQLTRDHTLAELARGLSEKASSNLTSHPETEDEDEEADQAGANILWNAIGGDGEDPHPDACALDLQIGDALLLCTDGLTKHISRKRIRELLGQDRKTDELCEQFVAEANEAGGSDNITVVISRFSERSNVECKASEAEVPLEADIGESLADTVELPAGSDQAEPTPAGKPPA